MAYTLKFNNVEMPLPDVKGGLTESFEAIWSSNTGRNSAGKMIGTKVATKRKLAFAWNGLTAAQAKVLLNAIYGTGFTTVNYYSALDGKQVTVTGYFGTPSLSHRAVNGKLYWATGISVDFIEQ